MDFFPCYRILLLGMKMLLKSLLCTACMNIAYYLRMAIGTHETTISLPHALLSGYANNSPLHCNVLSFVITFT